MFSPQLLTTTVILGVLAGGKDADREFYPLAYRRGCLSRGGEQCKAAREAKKRQRQAKKKGRR